MMGADQQDDIISVQERLFDRATLVVFFARRGTRPFFR